MDKLPFMDASFAKNIRPPKETSEPTYNRLFNDASPIVTSPVPAVNKPDVVMVLFVNVSVPASVARVFVPVGIVTVPLFEIDEITGVVSVLLVKV